MSSGEIVFRTVCIEIENLGENKHGNRGFRSAISEEETVFVRGSDGIRAVERSGGRRREVTESEETGNVVRIEDAEGRVLLDLDEDLDEGFFVEEEETETGGFGLRGGGGGGGERGDGDGGDGDGDVAFGSETEFFEEDHGASVGSDGEGFDFGGGGGEEVEEGGEEEEDGDVGFRHCVILGSECWNLFVYEIGVG